MTKSLLIGFFLILCAFSGAVYNQQVYQLENVGILIDCTVVIALHIAMAFVFGGIPFLRWPYFILMNAAGMATAYFYTVFGVMISYDSIAWLLETDKMEVKSFLTWRFVLLIGVSVLIGSTQSLLSKRILGSLKPKKYLAVTGAVLLGAFLLYRGSWALLKYAHWQKTYEAISLSVITPISIPKALRLYVHEESKSAKLLDLPNPADKPSSLAVSENERPVVVFIVGESLRASHLGINGYPRDTTPRLAQLKNLLNYGTCRSFANTTRVSLVGMLTDATLKERKPHYQSFINLFNKHGYTTNFISMQNKLGRSGHLTDALISCSQNVQYEHGRDINLVAHLKNTLKDNDSGSLVLLHMRGSHFSYRDQYADAYRKFTPDTYNNENLPAYKDNLINAYDNSVLKTDDLIASVIDAVRDKNAIVFYTSDHGVSLGERGVFLHGTKPEREQFEVPFLIWYSNQYQQHFPQVVESLKKNLGKQVTHDFIYHTLVGLGGIQSDVINPSFDLSGMSARNTAHKIAATSDNTKTLQ